MVDKSTMSTSTHLQAPKPIYILPGARAGKVTAVGQGTCSAGTLSGFSCTGTGQVCPRTEYYPITQSRFAQRGGPTEKLTKE
nr:hypothetical protein CFP56_36150 [Quercus suber]